MPRSAPPGPSAARLVVATWHLFRRERELLLAIALPLMFLPAWAVQLLCDPLPPLPPAPRDEVAMGAWIAAVTRWGQSNALWYVLADAAAIWGSAAIALLLSAEGRPTVAAALRRAGGWYLTYAAAALLVALPVGAGLWLFVIPGLWVQGRLAATLPALAHEEAGVIAALRRSVAVTRGRGLPAMGAVASLFLAQWCVAVPLASADTWLRAPGHENAVVLALVDAGIAAAGAAFHLAVLLLGVLLYRIGARQGT